MTDWLDQLEKAAGKTTCEILEISGGGLLGIATPALFGRPKASAAAFGLGSLSLLAKNFLCDSFEMDEASDGGKGGCWESTTPCLIEIQECPPPDNPSDCAPWATAIYEPESTASAAEAATGIKSAAFEGYVPGEDYGNWKITFVSGEKEWVGNRIANEWASFRLGVANPDDCGDGSDTKPVPPELLDPIQQVTDEGCNLTFNLLGFASDAEGTQVNPVYRIESAPQTKSRANDGGRMAGGCWMKPVIYYGGGGDGGDRKPPIVIPLPDDDPGGLDWKKILETALGSLAARAVAAGVEELLKPKLPPADFEFVAPCDKDQDGNQLRVVYQMPEQDYQSRVVTQQAVIMEILQQHLNWKTPVCFSKNEKGDYARSLSFESTPDPDNNYQRTRKRLGYRSDSPCDVRQLSAHWRDFVWNTGPVIVRHSGSALGSPQVWAASVDEGKRVIQHAGREAGVDPDQVGEWTIGSTDSPRYGVSATMRLKEVDGVWAATARIGPSDWPPSSKVTCDP